MKIKTTWLLLFVIIFLSSCYSKQSIKTGLEGKSLPAFSLIMSDSISYFNTENIPEGKPVVFYYYSPKCPYCLALMDEITDKMDKLSELQFYIITSSSISELKKFNARFNLGKYSNITTGVDYNNFFAKYFGFKSVPFLAVYGSDLKLKEAFIGKTNSKMIIQSAMN